MKNRPPYRHLQDTHTAFGAMFTNHFPWAEVVHHDHHSIGWRPMSGWISSFGLVLCVHLLVAALWILPQDMVGEPVQVKLPVNMTVDLVPAPPSSRSPLHSQPVIKPKQTEKADGGSSSQAEKTVREPGIPSHHTHKLPVHTAAPPSKIVVTEPKRQEGNSKHKTPPVSHGSAAVLAAENPVIKHKERITSIPNPSQLAGWQSSLSLKLNQAKRYPLRARRLRQQGVAVLNFTVDRNGQVLSAEIEKSSGFFLLDEETLGLIKRVQPLPVPPQGMRAHVITVSVPVVFSLNR